MSMSSTAMNPLLPTGNYYGNTVRQYQAGGFSLSETRYLPKTKLPRHSHESHYFCLVLRGSYRESYDRKLRSCEPSMMLYHPAGEVHAQSLDKSPVDLFRVEVNPTRLQYPNHPDLTITGCDLRRGPQVALAHKLYCEFREPDAVSHLAIEGIGLELIASVARDFQRSQTLLNQPPRWLMQAQDLIKSRYLEQLSLGDIARIVGVHPVTLAREFRRHYHCTVGEWVRRERIEFACRELVKRNACVAAVASAAGFYDQSHFARTFKKLTGMSPSQYRLNFRPS
jgi:AraC family transcriptional regulator